VRTASVPEVSRTESVSRSEGIEKERGPVRLPLPTAERVSPISSKSASVREPSSGEKVGVGIMPLNTEKLPGGRRAGPKTRTSSWQ